MIYRCTNPECTCMVEEDRRPECCPACGRTMLPAEEGTLTGEEWTILGAFWAEQGECGGARTLECFRRAAALGDPAGISNLGWCMENGVGIAADPRQAVWLYRQAAELNYPPAMCNLGYCLQEGIGTPPHPEQAVEWYQAAAQAGRQLAVGDGLAAPHEAQLVPDGALERRAHERERRHGIGVPAREVGVQP